MTPEEYHKDPAMGSTVFSRFDKEGRSMNLFPPLEGDHLETGHSFEDVLQSRITGDKSLLSNYSVVDLKGKKPKDFDLILKTEQYAPDQYLAYEDKDGIVHKRLRNTQSGTPNKTNRNLFTWWDYYVDRGFLSGKKMVPKDEWAMLHKLTEQTLNIPIEIPGIDGDILRDVIDYADDIKFQVPYFWDMPVTGGVQPVKGLIDFELWFGDKVLLFDLKTTATLSEFFRMWRWERWHQGTLYPEIVKRNGVKLLFDGMIYLIAEKQPLGPKEDPVYRTQAFEIGHDPEKLKRIYELAAEYRLWQKDGGKNETHRGWKTATKWRER